MGTQGEGFDDLILALHGGGPDRGPLLLDAALAALADHVSHDAAWLGHGALTAQGMPVLMGEHRRNLPADFADQWHRIRRFDPLAPRLLRVGDHAQITASPDMPAPLRRFLAAHGIGHALCVTAPGLLADGFLFLSLYRPGQGRAFADGDIRRAALFLRHLAVALHNRLAQGVLPPLGAVVTRQGEVSQAAAGVLARLAPLGVTPAAPRLPDTVMRRLLAQGAATAAGVRLALHPGPGVPILAVQAQATPLTAREGQIARAYATGQGFRDVAAGLGIAPSTARNHISAIYRKLGVASKVELARALDRPQ